MDGLMMDVCKIVAGHACVPVDQVKLDSKLDRDLNLDSLDLIAVVVDIEAMYGAKIPDAAIDKLKDWTVQGLVDAVRPFVEQAKWA